MLHTCNVLSPMILQAARLLHKEFQVRLVNVEEVITGGEVVWTAFDAVLLVASTYGSGAPPGSATR